MRRNLKITLVLCALVLGASATAAAQGRHNGRGITVYPNNGRRAIQDHDRGRRNRRWDGNRHDYQKRDDYYRYRGRYENRNRYRYQNRNRYEDRYRGRYNQNYRGRYNRNLVILPNGRQVYRNSRSRQYFPQATRSRVYVLSSGRRVYR